MGNYKDLLDTEKIYDSIPEGWRELKYAVTAPNGYSWIYNSVSILNQKERKIALLKL